MGVRRRGAGGHACTVNIKHVSLCGHENRRQSDMIYSARKKRSAEKNALTKKLNNYRLLLSQRTNKSIN